MPRLPLRPCGSPGCRELVRETRFCAKHADLAAMIKNGRKGHQGSRDPVYSSAKWKAIRRNYLAKYPACVVCGQPATVLDHITPHRGIEALKWDTSNLQGLCRSHHATKSARSDGWLGNPRLPE